MAEFNRLGSPMEICEESFEETAKIIELRKKNLLSRQATRSPFMIGSIEEINKKITRLDRRLQRYSLLICESRASDKGNVQTAAFGQEHIHSDQTEKERKEVNQFAGMYCVKSAFTPGLSERAKNISKISVTQSKQLPQQSKKETGKPKFVELQQYPGYEQSEITALPDDLPVLQILHLVTLASVRLSKKPAYRPIFEKLFYSDLSQALLCDLFWYVFLDKFQPSQHSQQRLFNRLAHNFVNLLMFAKDPQYRDSFFKNYPTLMSQAVYAAYCEAFPDSYRQFGENFKEYVVCLISEWMTGTKPAPRSWMKWNLRKLEPENITTREEILKQKSKKSTSLSFDFLDSLGVSSNHNQSVNSSNSNLNQSSSLSSMKNYGSKKRAPTHPGNKVSFARKSLVPSSHPPVVSTPRINNDGKKSSCSEKRSDTDPRCLLDTLTPVHEQSPGEDVQKRRKSVLPENTSISTSNRARVDKDKIESHPACKGPDFVRGVFNVQGQSPLVAHFLRMKKLESNSGTILRVQRTELENLPALDAPTYRDVIKESFKVVADIAKKHQVLLERGQRESILHHRKQRKVLRDHMNRESALLSKPREVKRLSDLLILEHKKDQDSVSAGADTAIEAALICAE